MKKILPILLLVFLTLISNEHNLATPVSPPDSTLVIEYATDLEELISNFIMSGVTVSNISQTGEPVSLGSFTGGNYTNIGMSDGIIIATGDVFNAYGPNNDNAISTAFENPGDPNLTALANWETHDASILEFDVVPEGNVLAFNYVFSSEEYHEYVGTPFNDVFAFFLTGNNPVGGQYDNLNVALIPETFVPVTINNINNGQANTGPCMNCQYFIDNTDGLTIQYDAFTTVLPIYVSVIPGEVYHLKMAIADCSDAIYDSGIFLQCPSLRSYTVTNTETKEALPLRVYPSPVNSASVLTYTLAEQDNIKIKVSTLTGSEYKVLYEGNQKPGNHSLPLNSLKEKGCYIISISGNTVNANIKVVVQ